MISSYTKGNLIYYFAIIFNAIYYIFWVVNNLIINCEYRIFMAFMYLNNWLKIFLKNNFSTFIFSKLIYYYYIAFNALAIMKIIFILNWKNWIFKILIIIRNFSFIVYFKCYKWINSFNIKHYYYFFCFLSMTKSFSSLNFLKSKKWKIHLLLICMVDK